jgi:pyruvate/2-oxoglutarate/acetoin dehydrogenase E1 component
MSEPSKISFVQGIHMALDEALATDPNVFLLGEDIADLQGGGVWKVCAGLSTKYGVDRVRSTPISEQAILGAAVGAAIVGMRPVAEIMLMNFITLAMDQIVNHAAKLRFMSGGQTSVPLTVRTATGAGIGFAGQHSDMLEAWFAHVPGLKVVTASSPSEAKGLLLSAIEDDDPTIFIENTFTYNTQGDAPAPGLRIPLGKANVCREGSDVTVVSYGRPIADVRVVADELAAKGISVQIVDLRTIAPFDETTVLEAVARTNRAVIVHEAVRPFGVGAEISSRIHEELFSQLKRPVVRVGSKYSVVPFARNLEEAYLYSRSEITDAIMQALD